MGKEINKVIQTAAKWIGYLEKKSNEDLDDFTGNAGENNYTCFARDYYKHTGGNYQGQAWCAMFVSEVLVQAFGLQNARKLLCGALYHYCPTGVKQFKAAGRWHTKPEPGDIIFFTNGTRAYHTGIVIEVTSSRVKTIEGNTSGASGVIENGGGVCQKSYVLVDSKIMGYGRPNYSIVAEPAVGWIKDVIGWWYRHDDGSYTKDGWEQIDEKWYFFDTRGYMETDWIRWKDKWYYCDVNSGAMVTGLQVIGGKCYYFNSSGALETGTVTLIPDSNGVLH